MSLETAEKSPTLQDVVLAVQLAVQQMHAEGSVDQEMYDLQSILKQALEGTITPIEALESIQGLLAARQNYH